MKIFKRFVSVLMSAFILAVGIFALPVQIWAEESEPQIIYRESFQKTGRCLYGNEYTIAYNVIAKTNGEIRFDFDCVSCPDTESWNNFGEIRINDSMVASLGSAGYAGESMSKVKESESRGTYNSNYSILESYSGDYTIYSLIKSGYYHSGNHIDTFYFYVKEPYLRTEQTINVCGTEIVIPFGDEIPTDEQTQMIHELESQINDLNTELEQLRAEKEVWQNNEVHLLEDLETLYKENEVLVARRGDINDDGLFTIADAVLLMRYVAGTIDSIPYYPSE